MDLNKVKEKLKKLLALSASHNENEAALAMAKAEDLMKKYGIRTVDVSEDGKGAYVDRVDIDGLTPKTASTWELSIARVVSDFFDAKAIYNRNPHFRICFVAGKSEIDMVEDLYLRIRNAVNRLSDAYVREYSRWHGKAPRSVRANYRMGAIHTVGQRLEKLKAKINAAEAADNTCTALVVVKKDAIEQRFAKEFPDARKGKGRKFKSNAEAYARGSSDGHRIGLGRSISGGSASSSLTH